jgi:hypothetical protein
MPKVFGLHEVDELPPGVTPEEYEQDFGKRLPSLPDYQGWKTYLLKGDRGERAGKFLVLFEIESGEARDRYYPRQDEVSDEVRRFDDQYPDTAPVWEKYLGLLAEPHRATDYLVVGEISE